MVGDQFFYPDILDLKDEILMDVKGFELPSDVFVFWTHMGLEYMWFDINEDDPIVTYWDVHHQPKNIGKFSDILLSFVNYFVEAKKEMPDIFDIP
jgi:hypothetical protein